LVPSNAFHSLAQLIIARKLENSRVELSAFSDQLLKRCGGKLGVKVLQWGRDQLIADSEPKDSSDVRLKPTLQALYSKRF
jgi:hypothetical protein